MPVVGHAIVVVRVHSRNLEGDIRDAVRRGAAGTDRDADAAGNRIGDRIGDRIGERLEQSFGRRIQGGIDRVLRREHARSRSGIGRLFSSFGGNLGSQLANEFRLGLGAGRPGPAIVSMIALAAPSAIGAAAALGVAAAGALVAALSSTLLAGGLLAAAFLSGAESLTAGQEAWKNLGVRIGTLVADGMAAGFAAGATTITDQVLPAIEGSLTAIGEAFGRMFEGIGKTFALPENIERLGSILDQNARFIDQFSAGLQGLTTAFLILWDASQPMIELVGSTFQRFGEWAATALAAADANGTLAKVMDNLTRLAEAMFGWISAIGPAFGDWLLNLNVEGIIAGWEAFGRIVGDLFTILGQIADGAGPHFVTIMDNVHQILSNMISSGVITTIADRIGYLLEKFTAFIAEVTSSDLGATIAAIGLGLLLFGGFLSPVVTLVTALGQGLFALAGALGAAALPVAAAVAAFALMWANSENLRNAITDLVTVLAGKFMELWDELSPKIAPLWQEIQNLAGALGDRLAPIIEALTPVFERFMDIVGTVLDFVITHLTEVIGFFADLFSGDFEGAWEHFKNIIANAVTFVVTILDELRLFIASVFTAIWDIAVQVWNSIWAFFEGILPTIVGAIQGASTWIQGIWNSAMDWLASQTAAIWNGIWAFFEGIFTEIKADVLETVEGLKAWWNNAMLWIQQTTTNIWNSIWAFIEGILTSIANAIRNAGAAIQTAWNASLSWVRDTAVNIWNSIWAFFENILSRIADAVRNAGTRIQQAWNAALTWVRDTAVNIWNGIWAFFENILSRIENAIRSAGAAIQTAWNNALTWVRDTAVNIWNSIFDWINNRLTDIADAIRSLGGKIQDGWNSILGAARSAWNSIYDAIIQPVINAYHAVLDWIGRITGAVSGLLDKLGGWVSEANDKLGAILNAQAQASVAGNAIGGGAGMGTSAQLARGGIILATPGGINAVVGEGRNNERIEPLDSQGLSRRDRALITQIVRTMTAGGSGSAQPVTVQVMVGDQELSSFITRVVETREDSLARQISRRRSQA